MSTITFASDEKSDEKSEIKAVPHEERLRMLPVETYLSEPYLSELCEFAKNEHMALNALAVGIQLLQHGKGPEVFLSCWEAAWYVSPEALSKCIKVPLTALEEGSTVQQIRALEVLNYAPLQNICTHRLVLETTLWCCDSYLVRLRTFLLLHHLYANSYPGLTVQGLRLIVQNDSCAEKQRSAAELIPELERPGLIVQKLLHLIRRDTCAKKKRCAVQMLLQLERSFGRDMFKNTGTLAMGRSEIVGVLMGSAYRDCCIAVRQEAFQTMLHFFNTGLVFIKCARILIHCFMCCTYKDVSSMALQALMGIKLDAIYNEYDDLKLPILFVRTAILLSNVEKELFKC